MSRSLMIRSRVKAIVSLSIFILVPVSVGRLRKPSSSIENVIPSS